jgi:hypothetical protein
METWINSTGLVFDIVGALLLWKYGLPEAINRDGSIDLILEQTSDEEVTKAKHYDNMSKIALGLLILGFALQLLSNFIPH